MDIGERIRLRRQELGMTQQELCNRMGHKNRSTIAKIESGVVDISHSAIIKFASVLDVTVEHLMGLNSTHPADTPQEAHPPEISLGAKIKQARIAKGLTQTELGKLLGVEKSAIAKYENGRVINLKHATLQKLTQILDLAPSDLVTAKDISSPESTASHPDKEKLLSIILRLSTDPSFLKTVESIHTLNEHQLAALQGFLDACKPETKS